jgi:hypothetical protein
MPSARLLPVLCTTTLLVGVVGGTTSCRPRAAPRVQSVVWRSDDVDDTVLLRADVSYLDDGRVDELFQQVGNDAIRWIFDADGDRVDEVTMLHGDEAERHALTWDGPRLTQVQSTNSAFKRVRKYTYWNDDARFVASIVSTQTGDDGVVQSVLTNHFGYDGDRLLHISTALAAGDDVVEGGVDFDIDKDTRQLARLAPDDESGVPAAARPALTWDIARDDEGRLGSVVTLDEAQRFDVGYSDDGLVDEVRIRQGDRSSRVVFTYDDGEVRGLGFGLDGVFGLACPAFPFFDLRGQSDGRLATDTFSGALGFLWAPVGSPASDIPSSSTARPTEAEPSTDQRDPRAICDEVGPACFASTAVCNDQFTQLEQLCSGSRAVEALAAVLACFRDTDTCDSATCSDAYVIYATAYNETCTE